MIDPEALAHAHAVKERHERELLAKPNVVGVGIGLRRVDEDEAEDVEEIERAADDVRYEVTLVVNVTRKVAEDALAPAARIPEVLEGVPVRVKAIGNVRAHWRGFSR
jgi:hypothetical protein